MSRNWDLTVVTDVPDEHIRRVIELGAEGCLRKEAGSDELTAALHLVADGLHYIQAELVGLVLVFFRASPEE